MIDLAKVTFGELAAGLGKELTISNAADLQVKLQKYPLGFTFRYSLKI